MEQDVEMRRVIPVIEQIRKRSDVCISIDTYRAATARAAIDAGADMINDISALRLDASMVELVAESNVPVVLMHMQGTPRHMQEKPYYVDCIGEITAFFGERIEFCRTMGVDKTKLILDPGIGFGKRLSDNLEILVHLGKLKKFRLPLMIGVSRKSFIGMLHPASDVPKGRIGGRIAAAVAAVDTTIAVPPEFLRIHLLSTSLLRFANTLVVG